MKQVEIGPGFEDWQRAARALLREGIPPEQVAWREIERTSLFDSPAVPAPAEGSASAIRVPRAFVDLARRVAAAPDPDRWRLLYEALWRIVHESRDLLTHEGDPAVRRLQAMAQQTGAQHPFPSRRMGPGPRAPRPEAPREHRTPHPDAGATRADDGDAPAPGAGSFIPAGAGLDGLRQAAARCQGCDLYRHASQTVFGRGPADARIVLVGEQPGDQEDRQGAPFVGPAGEVFDRALAEVGLARERLYVTNVVKHFKFVERGRRRIHQTPRAAEITACRPWVEAELSVIRPETLVCLGATAARALLGAGFRLMQERGRWVESRWAPRTMATLHPSAVLRGEDDAAQARLYGMLVDDLRRVAGG
jgi:DNA polymerase